MITVKTCAAQGDVLLRRVDRIPDGAKMEKQDGSIVIAHSETQHHHAIDAAFGAKLFRLDNDPMVCYLQISEPYADVVHHRSFDTHETLRLPTGTWEVRRQREWSPEGWKRVED